MFVAAITSLKAQTLINRVLDLRNGSSPNFSIASFKDGHEIKIEALTSETARIIFGKAYSEITSFFVNKSGETSNHVFQRLRDGAGQTVAEDEMLIADLTDQESTDLMAQNLIEERENDLRKELATIETFNFSTKVNAKNTNPV